VITEQQTCPRRFEDGREPLHGEGPDSWRADQTCTYCGSLHPDVFMERAEAGDVRLSPTDKDYKVYVGNQGGAAFAMTYRKDCRGAPTCTGPDDCTHWVTEERQETKFYFQHLSEAQQRRFVELHNAKPPRLHLDYPGHFYRLPFFMRRK